MTADLTDSHEVLISEFEILEREFDQFRVSKKRELDRLRKENRELRTHLRNALAELDELQRLLSVSYVQE